MIKSLIILVLLVVALGGAALSKPSQASFVDFYVAQSGANDAGMLKGSIESAAVKEYAKLYTYNDHVIYADVTRDGKTVFTGAFAHWFVRDETAAKPSIPKW